MIAGIERYAKYVRAVGNEETQYVQQAATFLGPRKSFMEQGDIPMNIDTESKKPDPSEFTPIINWAIK